MPILDQLADSPAIEYITCLRLLGRQINGRILKECVFLMLLEFVGMGNDYQFAAGEMFWLLPLYQAKISNDEK
jgi:hypothetical protein